MKGLLIVLIAAFAVGCSTTKAPTEPVATAPVITEPVPVSVVNIPESTPDESEAADARIDAAVLLRVLAESGCVVSRVEYKEVNRGGGMIVQCADRPGVPVTPDALATEGLEGL